ncbi:DUF3987 domain-containing protein [Enterobacter cloacae]|nr:DUF3987 domain-containing protein [Enterobacter cloacae]ELV2769784.1 DUF3987 domain-containing protein [Enterobacter cloacae]ELV2779019.1 DUF3987 domain-containing protein [Enterobacter cloacae]
MNLSPEIYQASQKIKPVLTNSHAGKISKPYPVASFPTVLENIIRSLHESTHIPVELVGNVVLAATSLACQSLIDVVQPHTNMPEPCSLYLMTIAESGEGKTTINKLVMKPLYAYAAEMKREYEEKLIPYRREHNIWKIRHQALNSNLRQAIKKGYSGEDEEREIVKHAKYEPQRPARPNFIYEDTSLKALVEGLGEHPEAGFISDEAITFFKSYLKNNPGLLNKAWDSEMFDFRRADGEVYQIKPLLTFSLMSQPEVFNEYLKKHTNTARASGFLSRFLFAWCESTIGSRNGHADFTNTEQALSIFYDRVNELLRQNKVRFNDNTYAPKKTLALSERALTSWKNNRTETEKKITSGNEWEHIRDIASKSGANTLRLAALLQYFYDDTSEYVSQGAMGSAITIMDWYLNQASQIFYSQSERWQFEQDVRELYHWIVNRIRQNNGFAILKNDLEKFGPHRLRRTHKLTPVLNQLISQGYFSVIQTIKNGALYVAPNLSNGMFILPTGCNYTDHIIIAQSPANTNGRPYPVDITGF